jgi:hypothetical protein
VNKIHMEVSGPGGVVACDVDTNGTRSQSFAWGCPDGTVHLALNGSYTTRAVAQGKANSLPTTATETGASDPVTFTVAAKPSPPTGLVASVDAKRVTHLTWAANREADLIGYQVQRAPGRAPKDTDWNAVGNTKDTLFDDNGTTAAGGDYSYRVVAVRAGATPSEGVASDPSNVQSVTVASPPTTTTAPGSKPGSSGSGTGSGTGAGAGSGTGAGTTGAGSGTAASAGSGSAGGSKPRLASSGSVDLSNFAALLDQSRQSGLQAGGAPRPAGSGDPGEGPDSGFNQALPFKKGANGSGGDEPAVGDSGALGVLTEHGGRAPVTFIAASLLVTVVLMHLQWLKREVDRVPLALPAVAPGEDIPEPS